MAGWTAFSRMLQRKKKVQTLTSQHKYGRHFCATLLSKLQVPRVPSRGRTEPNSLYELNEANEERNSKLGRITPVPLKWRHAPASSFPGVIRHTNCCCRCYVAAKQGRAGHRAERPVSKPNWATPLSKLVKALKGTRVFGMIRFQHKSSDPCRNYCTRTFRLSESVTA